jgi:putative hydrolase of the HAD superfamily
LLRARPSALLLDFDGVLRRYDPSIVAAAERRYGLPAGTVLETALEWPRLLPAITGRITRAEWLTRVAEALSDRVGGFSAARALLVEWDSYRGAVVPEVLTFVRGVRHGGVRVALATNATDDLDLDLAAFGLTGDFDAVANSAVLGVPKPTPEFFTRACELLGEPPERCLFVDDADRNVRGARAAGLPALRFNGVGDLAYVRAALSPGTA